MTSGSEPITEVRRADGADLDLRSTLELVELINDEDATVAAAVRGIARELAGAIEAISERLARGGRLIYAGAGSSGRLALLDAAEVGPTFGAPPGQVVALIAGGPAAQATAQEAAEDDEAAGNADLAGLGVGPDDAVVALSASGGTPYALGAARAAREAGALTVAIVCAAGSELGRIVEHELVAVTGPEVIAGSTRMKAGTAQKLILNTISTVSMVRLGKTYGNLMVDVQTGSEKLKDRARRIVNIVTGLDYDDADKLLKRAHWNVKAAIVIQKTGLAYPKALSRLRKAHDSMRDAIGEDIEPRLRGMLQGAAEAASQNSGPDSKTARPAR
jgi:N-acetylmuramic acid 6-phosphate etherase